MIQYRKRKEPLVLFVLMLIGLSLFFGLMFSPITFYLRSDNQSERLERIIEEDVLEREPLTEDALEVKMAVSPKEGESVESYQNRVEKFINFYNKDLERRQQEIKKRREEERNRSYLSLLGYLAIMGIGSFLSLRGPVLRNRQIDRYPIAFVLAEDFIEFPRDDKRMTYRINWADIHIMHYQVNVTETYIEDRQFVDKTRKVLIKNASGSVLETIDLSLLEQDNFNLFHDDISRLAPHIIWIYSE